MSIRQLGSEGQILDRHGLQKVAGDSDILWMFFDLQDRHVDYGVALFTCFEFLLTEQLDVNVCVESYWPYIF